MQRLIGTIQMRGQFKRVYNSNSQYPGDWEIIIERLECIEDLVISNEYWGDDGKASQWRSDKKIGIPIE